MPYNEELAARIRRILAAKSKVVEKKMFGGIAFMVRENMCIGLVKNNLILRVGTDTYEKLLEEPYVREMDFTGRPLKGYIYVDPLGFKTDKDLKKWIEYALKFNLTLDEK